MKLEDPVVPEYKAEAAEKNRLRMAGEDFPPYEIAIDEGAEMTAHELATHDFTAFLDRNASSETGDSVSSSSSSSSSSPPPPAS